MEERANVVVMRGNGQQRIRQAIMQGLLHDEMAADVNEVLRQTEKYKADLDFYADQNKRIEGELNRFSRIYYDAVKAHEREKARKARKRTALGYGAAFTAMFLIVLVCMIITRAIFG